MADQKPPRLCAGERETLLALLAFQRESLLRKLDGLGEAQLRASPVGSGTSLLWLVKHLTRAEGLWLLTRFLGAESPVGDDTLTPNDTAAGVVAGYRAMSAAVEAATASASLDDAARPDGDLPPVNLRWILMHLLEETARHAGHADILRELVDGSTGR
jgi:uncharacterized damage-inducible protein DinB